VLRLLLVLSAVVRVVAASAAAAAAFLFYVTRRRVGRVSRRRGAFAAGRRARFFAVAVVPRVVGGFMFARRRVTTLAAVFGRRHGQIRGTGLDGLLGRETAAGQCRVVAMVPVGRRCQRPTEQRKRVAAAAVAFAVIVVVGVVQNGAQVMGGGQVFLQQRHGRELAGAQPARVRRQRWGGRVGKVEPRERCHRRRYGRQHRVLSRLAVNNRRCKTIQYCSGQRSQLSVHRVTAADNECCIVVR